MGFQKTAGIWTALKLLNLRKRKKNKKKKKNFLKKIKKFKNENEIFFSGPDSRPFLETHLNIFTLNIS